MDFEQDILQSRAGIIRTSQIRSLPYVIFENIADSVQFDETKTQTVLQNCQDVARQYRSNATDEHLLHYHHLYYKVAVWCGMTDDDYSATMRLLSDVMPERIADLTTIRNHDLERVYDYSNQLNVPDQPTPRERKVLTEGDMVVLEPDHIRYADDTQLWQDGYLNWRVYQMQGDLHRLSREWATASDQKARHKYLITLYKLVILGFDPIDIDPFAEIKTMGLPRYYYLFRKW